MNRVYDDQSLDSSRPVITKGRKEDRSRRAGGGRRCQTNAERVNLKVVLTK